MKFTFEAPYASIKELPVREDLPDFVVLSGPNGAGKSHLLRAISGGALRIEGVDPSLARLNYSGIYSGSLGNAMSEAFSSDTWLPAYHEVSESISQVKNDIDVDQSNLDAYESAVVKLIVARGRLNSNALSVMKERAQCRLIEMSKEQFRVCTPILLQGGNIDPFQWQFSELCVKYYQAKERNEQLHWRNAQRGGTFEVLNDEEFLARYGPPPWQLINEIFEQLGLPYRVEELIGSAEQIAYDPRLFDKSTSYGLNASDLSSGEQALLFLAMSLYSFTNLLHNVRIPSILLLDEPDGSLHPSMVKALLWVLGDVFVERCGIKVIMTTHSPTTVALAPPESLYLMRREGSPRVTRVERDAAVSALAVGIPTLSVRLENRRHVFVEGADASIYEAVHNVTSQLYPSPISLQFIPSGRGESGNSDAVVHLVSRLRSAGNDLVWGIVDRDKRRGASEGVVFAASRYAIENLVLDPLPLGLHLWRERIVDPSELGFPSGSRFMNVREGEIQGIVDYVIAQLGLEDGERTVVTYLTGWTAGVPRALLDMQGHGLNERVIQRWPKLRGGAHLLSSIVDKTMRDVPECIPMDFFMLFGEISGRGALVK